MNSQAKTPEQYVEELLGERREVINNLRAVFKKNLPRELIEVMSYGMIGYVIPRTIYPKGYHVNPSIELPFVHLASQKRHIALYHMGLYFDETLVSWFKEEYSQLGIGKLDMGKSCVRFNRMDAIPYELVGELSGKMSIHEYIAGYEKSIAK